MHSTECHYSYSTAAASAVAATTTTLSDTVTENCCRAVYKGSCYKSTKWVYMGRYKIVLHVGPLSL